MSAALPPVTASTLYYPVAAEDMRHFRRFCSKTLIFDDFLTSGRRFLSEIVKI